MTTEQIGNALAPINAGQVYTTLQRLERDGLVRGEDVPGDTRQKRVYTLTDEGREALGGWVTEPASATRLRDEFFLKLVLAGTSGIADPRHLIEQQRRVIDQLLNEAQKQDDKSNVEEMPVKETAPAK